MEQIKKILISRNIRPSHHRIKILQYMASQKRHPTVGEIYKDLMAVLPTLSKATVYNTLRILEEKEFVTSFKSSGEENRYDYKSDSHAHFHCVQCDRIIDIESEYSCLKTRRIGEHKVLDVHLFFRGI